MSLVVGSNPQWKYEQNMKWNESNNIFSEVIEHEYRFVCLLTETIRWEQNLKNKFL